MWKQPVFALLASSALVFACTGREDAYELGQAAGYSKGIGSRQMQIDRFHKLFYNNLEDTWAANHWLGVQTSQNPIDVWVTQEILWDQKPDFMVEAGTKNGGSALIWAMVLREINPDARVITIDIEDQITTARDLPAWQDRIDFLHGSSTDPAIVAEVQKRVQGKKVTVLLDSDHSKEHVLNEMRAYAPFVNVGNYLIVQDTNLNGNPVYENYGPGPMEALEEFMSSNDDFESDQRQERMMLTFCPKGYLKRIK